MIRFYTLLFFCILLVTQSLHAANYYWVGGAGKWSEYNLHWSTSSGGTSFHSQVPTNNDHVFFDANSGFTTGNNTVTVDQTIAYSNDIDWTGALANPTFVSSLSTNTLKVFGSFKLSSTMTFSFIANLNFESNNAGNTITTAGKTIVCPSVTFNGDGTWTLNDDFTSNSKISHLKGTLNTNGKKFEVMGYTSGGSLARTLTLGASIFQVKGTGAVSVFDIPTTNFTLNPGTSTIFFTGASSVRMKVLSLVFNDLKTSAQTIFYMETNGGSFRKADFAGDATLHTGLFNQRPAFDSLVFAPGKTYMFDYVTLGATGKLVANGTCNAPIRIKGELQAFTTHNLIKTSGSVSLSYVILSDVGTNGGATFSASNSFDLGYNNGWTITSPASRNLYWIGGSGQWSSTAHWSLSSGGPANAGCIPSLADHVFFNANSGFVSGSYVEMDIDNTYCNDMKWTGATNMPQFRSLSSNSLSIAGSLVFIPAMTCNLLGTVTFISTATGKTITSGGQKFIGPELGFNGSGGWTLTDSLTTGDFTPLNLYAGELNTGGKKVTAGSFNLMSTPSLKKMVLNNSLVTITTMAWTADRSTNFVLSSGTSTIVIRRGLFYPSRSSFGSYYNVVMEGADAQHNSTPRVDASFYANFTGSPSATFHKLQLKSDCMVLGRCIYDSLVLTKGQRYSFSSGLTSTFLNGTLVADGTCSAPVFIESTTEGQKHTFSKATGNVAIDYAVLKDIEGVGGASFTATNSYATDVVGWTIVPASIKNLYWVGNSGNWNDVNHWSLSSGGTPGACIPGVFDNAIFDAQSFSSTGAVVTLDGKKHFCRDLDWTNCLFNPKLKTAGQLELYGSMLLADNMQLEHNGGVVYSFSGDGIADIKTANHALYTVILNTSGTRRLQDDFTSRQLEMRKGTLITNDYDITVTNFTFHSLNINQRALYLGSSTLTVPSFAITTKNFTLDAGTSTVVLNAAPSADTSPCNLQGMPLGLSFYNVEVKYPSKLVYISGNHSFNKLTLQGPAHFQYNATLDTLVLSPGRSYKFTGDSTVVIRPNGLLSALGQPGFPVEMISTVSGKQAIISKASGTVCLDYVFMKDMKATGGATFYAGANGSNVSNNSGWIFSPCTVTDNPSGADFEQAFSVYPVPAHGSFYIDAPEGEQAELSLVDLAGKTQQQLQLDQSHNEIQVKGLPAGLYYVILHTSKGQLTKKLMIY